MGLIKAAMNAVGGTLGDQYLDFIVSPTMGNTTLMCAGAKADQKRSTNHKGSENIITGGSKINVADGEFMMIVENGLIVDYSAEPGQFVFNSTTQPSFFNGGFKDFGPIAQQVVKRISAGGASTDQQFVYYINTKEILGNKIGIGNVPFRDSEFSITVKVQGHGAYSFKIVNPLAFYKNVVGKVTDRFDCTSLTDMMKSELKAAMQPALGRIAAQRIAYDQLIMYPREIGTELNKELSAEWEVKRGIVIETLALEQIGVDDASADMITEMQRARAYGSNAAMAGGYMATGSVDAMKMAAGNSNGAAQGFMGLGMMNMAGGQQMQQAGVGLIQQGQQVPPTIGAVPNPGLYTQGATNPASAPASATTIQQDDAWICSCGTTSAGKFCLECGKPKPEPVQASGWTCSCGAISQGKFCMECGARKPAGVPQYKCDKCGWKPEDPTKAPKFCPECGDPFGDEDCTVV